MPKNRIITVYQFDELSESAKNTARDWFKSGDEFDCECELDYAKSALELIGFENAEIRFSGFCSQCDGACFKSTIDLPKLLAWLDDRIDTSEFGNWFDGLHFDGFDLPAFQWLASSDDFLNSVDYRCEFTDSRYSHEYCARVSANELGSHSDAIDEKIEQLRESIDSLRIALSRKIYRLLESEYEYHQSDEYVDECIQANEYEFDINGERI